MKPHLCRIYFLLFSEFHDIKTETSMSWKELLINSVHLHSKEKSGNIFFLIEKKYRNGCQCFLTEWLYAK